MPNDIVIIMSLERNKRRHLHTLLLVTFVYQLHACPCGCFDKNGWFQAGRSLFAYVTGAADLHGWPRDSTTCPQVEDDHCNASGSPVFMAGKRSDYSSPESLVKVPSSQFSPQHLLTSIGSSSKISGWGISIKSRAQEVRAHLQVFLI